MKKERRAVDPLFAGLLRAILRQVTNMEKSSATNKGKKVE
jgi:hypothetical protein